MHLLQNLLDPLYCALYWFMHNFQNQLDPPLYCALVSVYAQLTIKARLNPMISIGDNEARGNEISYQFSSQPADVYLIDEPSAYLDSEQRIVAAKVIKRSVLMLLNSLALFLHP